MNDQEIKEMIEVCNSAVERMILKRITCSVNYLFDCSCDGAVIFEHYNDPDAPDGRACSSYSYPDEKDKILKLGTS